ncbi:hypothetical protein NDU88_005623 [Pleurodeles waltl]|uniref:Uncharacterized protein n=1 Tax=Pleurodeles waltl TaxID=8319 RepID=A0AAV7QL65_PLEWA|nr:hypothetical protein NDU88_005623 [Pleurodeles waltl]
MGCDPEDAEPGWPLRPPDREEELQRRTQVTGTWRVCDPELGRTGVTKREQRWAEVRRAGHRWATPGAEPGWPSRPPYREEELQGRIQATGTQCACGPGLGRSGVTKREQRWAEVRRAGRHDDPAAETGGGKPAGKAPAGPDRSYEARAALGRGEESRAPMSDSG